MKAYEILRDIHHLGSRMTGTVIAREKPETPHGSLSGHLRIETESIYSALLPYSNLVNRLSDLSPNIIPEPGTHIEAIVSNFVDGTIYLTARPSDLDESSIRKWELYYKFIASLPAGSVITGVVEKAVPFGLFVNIGGPFLGLIDVGHSKINGGVQLPHNASDWPVLGDTIRCHVAYFRFHNQQVGLGWLPE